MYAGDNIANTRCAQKLQHKIFFRYINGLKGMLLFS